MQIAEEMSDSQFVHNIMGQGRVNQLGGSYINGRPLPLSTRMKIIEMNSKNIKPCEISRELRISHGAVSKILNRYHESGVIAAGQIGGNSRKRLSIQSVEKQIALYKEQKPEANAQNIQQLLVDYGVCTSTNVPTVSSINRHLKARGLTMKRAYSPKKHNLPFENNPSWVVSSTKLQVDEKPKLKFSVDNLLQSPLDEHQQAVVAFSKLQSTSVSDERSESESSTPISRSRTYFTPEQVNLLETAYSTNPYPDQNEKEMIAAQTGLNENKVQVWFSNRRARQRKNLTNSTVHTAEHLLRSAAIQQHQQQAILPSVLPQLQLNSISPQTVFAQTRATHPTLQQSEIWLLSYWQQQLQHRRRAWLGGSSICLEEEKPHREVRAQLCAIDSTGCERANEHCSITAGLNSAAPWGAARSPVDLQGSARQMTMASLGSLRVVPPRAGSH